MKNPEELSAIYARIPVGTDIIISHPPPYGYGDALPGDILPIDGRQPTAANHTGPGELLASIDRTQPKAVICGYIHNGHGVYSHGGTAIYNVAVVDDQCQLIHGATEIRLSC
jgi:Icc-related predicted phosphoesterase